MVRDFIDHLCAQTNRYGEPLAPNTIRWIMAPLKAMPPTPTRTGS